MSERTHVTRSRANPGGMDVERVLGTDTVAMRALKPPWFKVPAPGGPRYRALSELIRSENLHTVCQEAACPNVGECWQRGTATFMLLGDRCTRRCGYCAVATARPQPSCGIDSPEALPQSTPISPRALRPAAVLKPSFQI